MLKQKVCTDDVNPKPTKKKQYMEKKPGADILLCLQIHMYILTYINISLFLLYKHLNCQSFLREKLILLSNGTAQCLKRSGPKQR